SPQVRSAGALTAMTNFLMTADITLSSSYTRLRLYRARVSFIPVPRARAGSFLVFANLVDIAHAGVEGLARLELLAPEVEQLVPQLVLAAVRKDEPVVGLVPPLDSDGLRIVDRVVDRRRVREHFRAVCVLLEGEALVDRGLIAERVG